MTLDHIHDLVRKMDRRERFLPAILALALVFVGLMIGRLWMIAHTPLMRVEAVLFLAGELGAIFVIYRASFTPRDPAAPVSAYLRRRLQRKLSYLQGGWTLALLSIAPGMLIAGYVVFVTRHGPLWPRLAPFVLLAALVVFTAVRAGVRAGKIRAQIHELDELLDR